MGQDHREMFCFSPQATSVKQLSYDFFWNYYQLFLKNKTEKNTCLFPADDGDKSLEIEIWNIKTAFTFFYI